MEIVSKKKILLCWWYDRYDLIKPFLMLKEQFEFTVLFYRYKEQEDLKFDLPFERLYWTKFSSPNDILNLVNPHKIIFMGIENFLTISLLMAAKSKGINTLYLFHGVDGDYFETVSIGKEETEELKLERYRRDSPFYQKNKLHTYKFLLNAITIENIVKLPSLLKLAINLKRYNYLHEALRFSKSETRQADYYLCLAPEYSNFYKFRDAVPESKIINIGPYNFDEVFQGLVKRGNHSHKDEDYWLLIDQPLVTVDKATKLRLLKTLAGAALKSKKLLIIKLHPQDYSIDFPALDNTIFVRDEREVIDLIHNAAGCFGYFSTLLLPIIYFKKTYVIKVNDFNLPVKWAETGAAKLLYLNNIDNEDINFDWRVEPQNLEEYKRKYLQYADGNGLKRIADFLNT